MLKVFITLIYALVTLFFVTTVVSIFAQVGDWKSAMLSVPVAALVAWSVWRSASGDRVGLGYAVIGGALTVGGLAFGVGFLGPMVFAPGANQGPLLGFITGPIGLLVGAVGGVVYWQKRNHAAQ